MSDYLTIQSPLRPCFRENTQIMTFFFLKKKKPLKDFFILEFFSLKDL